MQLSKEVISKLNPCTDRWNNYLKHYENFTGSLDEFLELENISYSDKIWVGVRLLNKNQKVHFGLLCAQSVAELFNDKYPDDNRVNDLLNYMMKIEDFSNLTNDQVREIERLANAAYAAANAANAAANAANAAANAANAAANVAAYAAANVAANAANAAAYAAYAAANVAAYAAANVAAYAAYAAAYAAANVAANVAANAAANAAAVREKQQNHNLELLKMAASL